jgi:hypothetical protein
MLVGESGVEPSFDFREPAIGELPARRFQRSPDPLPIVDTIDVERATAFVSTDLPTARPEKSAGPEVSSEHVELGVCFHGVHITSEAIKSVD